MKYTPGTIAKALVAFGISTIGAATAAAHGTDLSGLDFGAWLGAIGTGLVAGGGVFAVPNKTDTVPSSADQAITGIQDTVQQVATAQAELDRVRDAATGALSSIPVLGPLANEVINSLPRL